MGAPLGRTVGNALEVRESIDVLKGAGPGDVRDISLVLASRMILLAGLSVDVEDASGKAEEVLDDGRALEVFSSFVSARGGDPRVTDDPKILPRASVVSEVRALSDGFVTGIDALAVGLAATGLGAGRTTVQGGG